MDFDGKAAMEVMDKNELGEDFVKRVAPRVVEGISRLKAFVLKYQ